MISWCIVLLINDTICEYMIINILLNIYYHYFFIVLLDVMIESAGKVYGN